MDFATPSTSLPPPPPPPPPANNRRHVNRDPSSSVTPTPTPGPSASAFTSATGARLVPSRSARRHHARSQVHTQMRPPLLSPPPGPVLHSTESEPSISSSPAAAAAASVRRRPRPSSSPSSSSSLSASRRPHAFTSPSSSASSTNAFVRARELGNHPFSFTNTATLLSSPSLKRPSPPASSSHIGMNDDHHHHHHEQHSSPSSSSSSILISKTHPEIPRSLFTWIEGTTLRRLDNGRYVPLDHPASLVRSTISIAFSHDGSLFASTHGDHTVKVVSYPSGTQMACLDGHPRTPWTVRFHPHDKRFLASGCLGYECRIWDISKNSCIRRHTFNNSISCVSFSPDGDLLAVTSGRQLLLWDYWKDTRDPNRAIPTPENNNDFGRRGTAGRNQRNVNSANSNGDSTRSAGIPRELLEGENPFHMVDFHPSGTMLMTGEKNRYNGSSSSSSTTGGNNNNNNQNIHNNHNNHNNHSQNTPNNNNRTNANNSNVTHGTATGTATTTPDANAANQHNHAILTARNNVQHLTTTAATATATGQQPTLRGGAVSATQHRSATTAATTGTATNTNTNTTPPPPAPDDQQFTLKLVVHRFDRRFDRRFHEPVLEVPRAVAYNDAGIHFSPCGTMLAACIPEANSNKTFRIAVLSLVPRRLSPIGSVLFSTSLDRGHVTALTNLKFSSTSDHLLAGFSFRPTNPVLRGQAENYDATVRHNEVQRARTGGDDAGAGGRLQQQRRVIFNHDPMTLQQQNNPTVAQPNINMPPQVRVVDIYRVAKNLPLIRSLCADMDVASSSGDSPPSQNHHHAHSTGGAEDEINVAVFAPAAGIADGVVYGTQKGRIRLFQMATGPVDTLDRVKGAVLPPLPQPRPPISISINPSQQHPQRGTVNGVRSGITRAGGGAIGGGGGGGGGSLANGSRAGTATAIGSEAAAGRTTTTNAAGRIQGRAARVVRGMTSNIPWL